MLITRKSQDWLFEIGNFSFLQKSFQNLVPKISSITQLISSPNLRPTIYFSTSLKDQFRYKFFNGMEPDPIFHKYLKTKTNFLLYQKDHEIKTNYHKKYDQKDLYTATLIPEYGSWIRFSFQKNTKVNIYKYPIKNQEDEVIIQLDKQI